jgi:type I restriction enzyme S subunit
VPELRFKEFNGEWEEKKLGDIAEVNMCKRIYANQTKEFGDIPFYKIGTFGKTPDSYISKELFTEYKDKYHFPQKGDLLISASGTIGRIVEYNGDDAYYQDSNIVWMKLKQGNLLNRYLKYIYETIDWNRKLEGSTIKRLYNKDLLSLEVILPTLREQQKIADFLSTVDGKLENIEGQIEHLETLKKGFLQKIFSQELRFKDENGNEFPDWEEKKLGEVGKFKKGKILSKNHLKESGVPCVLYGELFTIYDEIIRNIISCCDDGEYNFAQKNDLLFPTSTTVDNLSLISPSALEVDEKVAIGGDILYLRPNNSVIGKFLSYQINTYSIRKEFAKKAQGTTIIHIYEAGLSSNDVHIPVYNEQQKIADFLSAFDEKIEIERVNLECWKNIKKGLLQKMFV